MSRIHDKHLATDMSIMEKSYSRYDALQEAEFVFVRSHYAIRVSLALQGGDVAVEGDGVF